MSRSVDLQSVFKRSRFAILSSVCLNPKDFPPSKVDETCGYLWPLILLGRAIHRLQQQSELRKFSLTVQASERKRFFLKCPPCSTSSHVLARVGLHAHGGDTIRYSRARSLITVCLPFFAALRTSGDIFHLFGAVSTPCILKCRFLTQERYRAFLGISHPQCSQQQSLHRPTSTEMSDCSSRLKCSAFASSFSFVVSALFSPSSCIILYLCATVATRWAGKALRMPLRVRRTKSATKSPSLPLPFQRQILRNCISSKTINPH